MINCGYKFRLINVEIKETGTRSRTTMKRLLNSEATLRSSSTTLTDTRCVPSAAGNTSSRDSVPPLVNEAVSTVNKVFIYPQVNPVFSCEADAGKIYSADIFSRLIGRLDDLKA